MEDFGHWFFSCTKPILNFRIIILKINKLSVSNNLNNLIIYSKIIKIFIEAFDNGIQQKKTRKKINF